jgi:hypothetical protein
MQRLKTTAVGSLVIIDNNLIFKHKDDWSLKINNLCRDKNNLFYQVAGWYVYPEPLDLTCEYEVEVLNEFNCHLIRKHEQRTT